MKLVELISAEKTAFNILDRVAALLKDLGKVTVISKDSPGFIVNRVARHYYLESLRILGEGGAKVEEIDELLKSAGFKMGPFELMDLIGIDVNLAVSTAVYNGFNQNPKYKPNPIQIQKVKDGQLGKKTGKGMIINKGLRVPAASLRLFPTQIPRLCLLLTAYCLLFLSSCKQDLSDDAIPQGFFPDIVISLNFPQYAALRFDGGYVNIDGGVRGIIVYRKSSSTYLTYERNCSYHPNDACATVEVHSSNLYIIDTCCGSSFDFVEGTPTGGPAWRPLRKYRNSLTGTDLTITSESANSM